MVPKNCSPNRCQWPLPRTRGDGPLLVTGRFFSSDFAPHTRGWSSVAYIVAGALGLCPAHAGMVPILPMPYRVPSSLPRTRGGGPRCPCSRESFLPFAAHTRGWSPRIVDHRIAARLCPAHAGMVPSARTSGVIFSTLPRTRGDGPGLVARPFASESFASYAGECNDRLKINFHPLEDGIGGVTGEYRLPFAPQLSA